MVKITLSKVFIRYALEACTRLLPVVLRLYNGIPEEQPSLGYLSAFLTTLRSVLSLAAHEGDPQSFAPEVYDWDGSDWSVPMEWPDPVDLLSSMEEEL